MDTIVRVFFERPWPIFVAAGVVEIAFLVFWWMRRTRAAAWALLGPVAVALLVWLLSVVVVTDRERIERNLDTILRAIEAGDAATVGRYIHPDYADSTGADASMVRATVETLLGRADVRNCQVTSREITVDGDSAGSRVAVLVEADVFDVVGRPMPMTWQLTWRQSADAEELRWRVVSAELIAPEQLRQRLGY